MTRITDSQSTRSLLSALADNRQAIADLGDEVSSGEKVQVPSDSTSAGTVSRFQISQQKIKGYKDTIASVEGALNFQDSVLQQASDLMVRAKELATQGANETNSANNRAQIAEEVFQLRDQLAQLANSKYQGKYIFGGANDTTPPFTETTYTEPATGGANVRYAFNTAPGTTTTRTVNLTDNLTITANTSGDVFKDSLESLERLGRSLAGYTTLPPTGTPTGAGTAYVFPTDYSAQTTAIAGALDLIDAAKTGDLTPADTSVTSRLRRIDTARSLLELTSTSNDAVLNTLTSSDIYDAATRLSQAQTSLQASLAVTARVGKLSLMDYI